MLREALRATAALPVYFLTFFVLKTRSQSNLSVMHMHQCKSEVEEEEGVTLLFHILQNTQLVAHQPSQPLLCLCARDLYHTV